MTTSVIFGAAYARGTAIFFNDIGGGVQAVTDDGAIAVGDEVTLTGPFNLIALGAGISATTLKYLGNRLFDGTMGFVFGNTESILTATEFFIAVDESSIGLGPRGEMTAWAANPTALGMDLACFAEGTMIATAQGEIAVENVLIGDHVLTAQGKSVPVKWVGRQSILKAFAGARAQLVRIGAGALGNHSDLYVTGDHGMVVYPSSSEAIGGKNGCIVNASALVDGDQINWVRLADTPDRQTVYQVETEAHDILLANGALTESYIDMPGRRAFDNFAEYLDLYGAERTIAPNPLPRISSPRLLPRRGGVARRAAC